MTPMTAYEPEGSWDSIHVFETAERGRQAHYKLTSTVMLQLLTRKGTDNDVEKGDTNSKGPEEWKREGEVSLSGSMTRQVCGIVAPGQSHVKFFLTILTRKSFHSGAVYTYACEFIIRRTNLGFSTDRTGLADT
jgi:F-actin capping protein, beta subunit